jgi:hypothetical protein
MAKDNLGSSSIDFKTEHQIAAINNLLADPAIQLPSPDLEGVLASRPETLSDLLACLLALHAEMFDFAGYNLLNNLPAEAKQALAGMEQRWTRSIRNAIACLSEHGATVPPAYGEFFSTQLIQ